MGAKSHGMIRPLVCLLIAACPTVSPAGEDTVKPKIAVYDLENLISESGRSGQSPFDVSMDASRPLTMLDVTRSLEKAAADDAVDAVVLDVDGATLDFSQLQQIRRQLLALRAADKDVWMYTERMDNTTALLGSAANHFVLMPEAACEFNGIRSESMYFKGLLDRVGVRADVIHIGDFKSFGETFYRTGPSDSAKQQEEKLVDSIFSQIVASVATGRKLDPAKVRAAIDDGGLTPAKAVETGLADRLSYRTDFVQELWETYGEDADFDREYELPDLDGPEITGLMDVFKLMFSEANKVKARKDFIAVVALEGDITDQSIAPVRTWILKLAKEERAQALVLRVNSPGGSAMASEVLWEATEEWNATGKPFAVSMGGVAASGGYYVSSAADRIFAEEGTITGSIGVVGMKFVVGEALEKIGITTSTTQRGRNAGAMSMIRGFTKDEERIVRESMSAVYETFKKRVTDGRGKALKVDFESLAGGRVYSGKDALDIGLVDEIGGLHEAVAWVTREAKLEKPDVKLLPEPKSDLEGLFAPADKEDDEEIIRASVTGETPGALRVFLKSSGLLETLPAPAKGAVFRLASRMEAFRKPQVLLLGPDFNLR